MKDAIKIIKKLKSNGYEAYLVGGVVRDHILGIVPNDIDITTSATPEEVMKLFKSFPSGLKFGSVTVVENSKNYEVTTFRLDFDYKDSRRPSKIKYASKAVDDVMRRDFTVNALLMDENYEIIDYVGGLQDIKNKLLRAVGDASKRFEEDALRILRAIHFVSKLGFDIEENTKKAIIASNYKLLNLAGERILQELLKMQKGKFCMQAILALKQLQIINTLTYLRNGVNYYLDNNYDRYEMFVIIAGALDNSLQEHLRLTRKDCQTIEKLTDLFKHKPTITPYLIYLYGQELTLLYNDYLINTKSKLALTREKYQQVFTNTKFFQRDKLLISNNKIIEIVNKPAGPWVKEIECFLLKKVLNENYPNTTEELVKLVKETFKDEISRK